MAGRWLLMEWDDGSRSVVNVRAVEGAAQEFQTGEQLTIASRGGGSKQGKLLTTSDDRKHLELQTQTIKVDPQQAAPSPPGPSLYEDPEPGDYSPSGSSWGPADGQAATSDSDNLEVDTKKMKLEVFPKKQYTNKGNKKSLTPTLRADPIIPKSRPILPHGLDLKGMTQKIMKRKKESRQSILVQQAMADSTKGQSCTKVKKYDQQCQTNFKPTITISPEEHAKVKKDLIELKEMFKVLKDTVAKLRYISCPDHLYKVIYATVPPADNVPKPDENQKENDNRLIEIEVNIPKDDLAEQANVEEPKEMPEIEEIKYGLIKHNARRHKAHTKANDTKSDKTPMAYNKKKKRPSHISNTSGSPNSELGNDEMVPIGSGNTFVPKSVYARINWDSYTMATRKLLMAVFPRKILASHSLTGKASPAFTDKPVKLCLDPKKVFDIVITVTNNCKVKEGLVRSAITTKCADEYKMQRMKLNKEEKRRRTVNSTPFRVVNRQLSLPADNYEERGYNQSI